MSSPSTLRDIVVPAPEPGVVTCILKDAAELAFHLAEEGGGQQHDDAYAAAPAVVSTRGNTLRMVPAAPISSIVLRESSPSVHDGRASEPPSGPAALPSSRSMPSSVSGLVLLKNAPVITLAPLPEVSPSMRRSSPSAAAAWILAGVLAAATFIAGGWVVARMLWPIP